MTEILAVRHLPTSLNQRGILQGLIDEDIVIPSAELLVAVESNRVRLKEFGPFDFILTSSLRRTISTARVYGFCRSIEEPLLNELNFGEYEGRYKSEMQAEVGKQWRNEPQHLILGESLLDLECRVRAFLEKYNGCHRVLLFGHGAWMRAMLSLSIHGDIKRMNKMTVDNNTLYVTCFP